MTQHVGVVVGGGQAGLAAGYHLRRRGLENVILDAGTAPGGSWQNMWNSLHLFSPAEHSSLPGRLMPSQAGATYPDAGHVVDHLSDYEKRYDLPVQHGTRVDAVHRDGDRLLAETDSGTWRAKAVFSATGTWSRHFLARRSGARAISRRRTRPTTVDRSRRWCRPRQACLVDRQQLLGVPRNQHPTHRFPLCPPGRQATFGRANSWPIAASTDGSTR